MNQKPGNLGIPTDSAKPHPALEAFFADLVETGSIEIETAGGHKFTLATGPARRPRKSCGIVTEKLGRRGALAALHETNGSLAEAYAATQLQGAPHATFGACDLRVVQSLVLSHVPPP